MVKSESRSKNTIKTWDLGNGVGFRGIPRVWSRPSSGVSSLMSSSDAAEVIYGGLRLCHFLGEKQYE